MTTPAVKVAFTGIPGVKGSNLFNLINGLRYMGKGAKVTRSIFKFPETYYIITKVRLSKDQGHGDVWGKLVWRGIRKNYHPRKLASTLKKEWKILDLPDYNTFKGSEEEMEDFLKTHGEERVEWTTEEEALETAEIDAAESVDSDEIKI